MLRIVNLLQKSCLITSSCRSYTKVGKDKFILKIKPTPINSVRTFIQVQNTPNPHSLKFLPGKNILQNDKMSTMDFPTLESAINSPFARNLFSIKGVKGVFLGTDFVTITKVEDVEWSELKSIIFGNIMDYLSSNLPIVNFDKVEGSKKISTDNESDAEVIEMINELLDSRIRPTVQEDGGDIEYRGYSNGVIKLKLQGACSNCPSSSITLKSGIQNMIQYYIPEVLSVEEVFDESDQIAKDEFENLETKIRVKNRNVDKDKED
ncbi:hypothetical protein A3Q56_02303 [Intoshia linei]|uniref:NFU1 iron-sulfur cluster scaffold homolog, mitochondrial n=1 Tax=Intoshia linei TaxID=1819745 RepID=A0A177B764_9BILA|nr:hypothetical protein A3Q56_02303 [Intoshia linei]